MATSGTTTFAITESDIITEALELIGVLDAGETPTTNDTTSARRSLNILLKSLQADPFIDIRFRKETTLSLSASTASYSLASDCKRVLYAWLLIDGTRVPLTKMTEREYDCLLTPSSGAQPTSFMVDMATDQQTMTLYPVPAESYTLYYVYEREVEDMTATGENPDYPIEASEMLIYGLASQLTNKFQLPLEERGYWMQKYNEAKKIYRAGNTELTSLDIKVPKGVFI